MAISISPTMTVECFASGVQIFFAFGQAFFSLKDYFTATIFKFVNFFGTIHTSSSVLSHQIDKRPHPIWQHITKFVPKYPLGEIFLRNTNGCTNGACHNFDVHAGSGPLIIFPLDLHTKLGYSRDS